MKNTLWSGRREVVSGEAAGKGADAAIQHAVCSMHAEIEVGPVVAYAVDRA